MDGFYLYYLLMFNTPIQMLYDDFVGAEHSFATIYNKWNLSLFAVEFFRVSIDVMISRQKRMMERMRGRVD